MMKSRQVGVEVNDNNRSEIIIIYHAFSHTLLCCLNVLGCSTNPLQRWVFWTSKSELSCTTKCDQFHEFSHTQSYSKRELLPQRSICWTSKSDLSSTTKSEQIHSYDCYEVSHTRAGAKRELRGQFVEQKLVLSSSSRQYPNHDYHCYVLVHTVVIL